MSIFQRAARRRHWCARARGRRRDYTHVKPRRKWHKIILAPSSAPLPSVSTRTHTHTHARALAVPPTGNTMRRARTRSPGVRCTRADRCLVNWSTTSAHTHTHISNSSGDVCVPVLILIQTRSSFRASGDGGLSRKRVWCVGRANE